MTRVIHRRKHRRASAKQVSPDRDVCEVMFWGGDGRLVVRQISGVEFTKNYRRIQPNEPR